MAKSTSQTPQTDGEVSFEQALAELEGIVRQLEEGKLGLSESLAQYERGVKRLKECYGLLERAERRIDLLDRVDSDGEPVTRPFADEATIEQHTEDAAPQGPAEAARGNPAKTKTPSAPRAKPARRPAKPPPADEPRDLFG